MAEIAVLVLLVEVEARAALVVTALPERTGMERMGLAVVVEVAQVPAVTSKAGMGRSTEPVEELLAGRPLVPLPAALVDRELVF